MSNFQTIHLNANSVPVTSLVTVNTVLVVAVAMFLSNYLKLDTTQTVGVVVAFLAGSVFLHQRLGIPNNLAYYFGLGEKPAGWDWN